MFKSLGYGSSCLVTMLAVCLWGCKPQPVLPPVDDQTENDHAGHEHGGHGHAAHGPHGGDLIELGNDQYHAELLPDDQSGKVTIYILDGQAKNEVTEEVEEVVLNAIVSGKPTQFELTALDGSTSGFEIVSVDLIKALDDHDAKVKLSVTIDGGPFSGEVSHGHDHGHKH